MDPIPEGQTLGGWRPRPASEWSDAEKIAAFDRLHAAAVDHFDRFMHDEWKYRSGERDHILFYQALDTLLSGRAKEIMSPFHL